MASGVGIEIVEQAWASYQHRCGGNATRAKQTAADIDLDSPLMRLAAGGVSPRPGDSSLS
ncbi:hypothetical protein AB0J82_22220 [Asanoa sp. NPDC049518]|uniref:hypothetical protein n=1 Tax=unclassified Asanoa TaxID=2685164 RepID=UPI003417092A